MKVVSPKFILVMYMKLRQGGRKKSPQSLEKKNFSMGGNDHRQIVFGKQSKAFSWYTCTLNIPTKYHFLTFSLN